MRQVKVDRINNTTYRFTETAFGANVYAYLLIGEKKALLIDTAYGFTDIPTKIATLTDLPLLVVNTHGHMDHIHGNHLYPEVYLSRNDEEVFLRHNDPKAIKNLIFNFAEQIHIPKLLLYLPSFNLKGIISSKPSIHTPLPLEMYFDLGNRRITIIETPGHTAGSISLLDEKNRWLFSGDTCCHDGVLLNFPESTNISVFKDSICKLKSLIEVQRINMLFPSHQKAPLSPSILDIYEEACNKLLNGLVSEKVLNKGVFSWKGVKIHFPKTS